jgi:ABC-type phosphate transport system substrate-binding protein
MKTRILILLFTLAACALPQPGYSVVVNKDNPSHSVSKAQLRKMILGEATSWPGGAKVVVLLGPSGDGARAAALKAVCGMSEAEFAKHALEASFAGAGKSSLKTLPSAAAVRAVAALTPGAVGIVEGGDAGAGLRVLTIE